MRARVSLLVIFLLFFANAPLLAQESASKTFTTDDQSFSFDYPADWTVEVINADQGPNAHLSVDNLPLDQRFESTDGVNLQVSLPSKHYQSPDADRQTPKDVLAQSYMGVSPSATIDFATPSADKTPQPLQLQPATPDVREFFVNDKPAAYVYNTMSAMGFESSTLSIVADLGDDYWVSITATSFKGGLKTLQLYEPVILGIVQTMRYVPPPPVYSGDPDLPQVYSGLVGIWQRGYITFYYPENWYVPNVGMTGFVVISNKPDNLINTLPVSGQFIASVNGVSETRSSADPSELFNQCETVKSDLTARTLVEKMLSNITSSQLEQLKNSGIMMTQPEVTTSNGKEIVYLRQYQNDLEVLAMFVDLGDGNIPSIQVMTKKGEMSQFEPQLFAVAGTFQYEAKPCDPQNMLTPTGS